MSLNVKISKNVFEENYEEFDSNDRIRNYMNECFFNEISAIATTRQNTHIRSGIEDDVWVDVRLLIA